VPIIPEKKGGENVGTSKVFVFSEGRKIAGKRGSTSGKTERKGERGGGKAHGPLDGLVS